MTEIQPPSFCGTDTCYTPGQFRSMFSSFICDQGVAQQPIDSLEVVQGTGMNVVVRPGTAYIESDTPADGTFYNVINDADVSITISASDPTDDRIDLVVASIDPATCSWELEVVTGVPSPVPTAPVEGTNQLSLATVYVNAGVSSILTADITDVRVVVSQCQTGPSTVVYNATGSFDPTDYPNSARLKIQAWGGGGGGGGVATTSATEAAAGSGGGGGAYVEGWVQVSELGGSPVTVTIGAGGNKGTSGGTQPTNGGASSFGTFVIAGGGAAGTSDVGSTNAFSNESGGVGGVAGAGTHHQLAIVGAQGDNGGSNGPNNTIQQIGFGGQSPRGGAGGRTGPSDFSSAGHDGVVPGGGGCGAFNRNSQSFIGGGDGARGQIIVEVWS